VRPRFHGLDSNANQNQASFYLYTPQKISVLPELTLGHLCYVLTDVPPQPNSPPNVVSHKSSNNIRSRAQYPGDILILESGADLVNRTECSAPSHAPLALLQCSEQSNTKSTGTSFSAIHKHPPSFLSTPHRSLCSV
jgi:hypothetical protein